MTATLVRDFTITRDPKHEGYDDPGSSDTPGEDYDLYVDGRWIAWTYWADALPDGEKWVSWGIAGWSGNHRTREDAEAVQIREYATNPDEHDRALDEAEAERVAEVARHEAEYERQAQEREAERTRQRLGTDQPGPTIWTAPAYHHMYGDQDEVAAVRGWLEANVLDNVSGTNDIRVEQRATRTVIVFEQPLIYGGKLTETHVVTMTVDPPALDIEPRPDLHELFAVHWPTKFPLIDFGQEWACGHCTAESGSYMAVVPWRCPTVEAAIARQAVSA